MGITANAFHRYLWNKGKTIGQKAPFKLKHIRALLVRLQMEGRVRELALFNLASTASCGGATSSHLSSATSMTRRTWGRASTHESWKAGSRSLDLTRLSTARTRFGFNCGHPYF
jgi:hypothetical protein